MTCADLRAGRVRKLCLAAAALTLSLAACAREPKPVSLSAVTYNYGEAYADLKVNGKWAGAGSNSVKPGDVTGGSSICCIQIPEGARTATVVVQTGVDKFYTVEAPVEQPWPDSQSNALIHVLPGRKVVIEITPGDFWPRKDLLEDRLRELNIEKQVEYEGPMSYGPLPVDEEKGHD